MLLNELLSTLSENTRLKVISFLAVCFMCLTVSRSLFPTIKKDEVMRDDLSLPNSTNSDTLTVRNQRKHTNTTGKWKLMKTWLVACFFHSCTHLSHTRTKNYFKPTLFPVNVASLNRIDVISLCCTFHHFSLFQIWKKKKSSLQYWVGREKKTTRKMYVQFLLFKQEAGELNKKLSQKDSKLCSLTTEYNIPK